MARSLGGQDWIKAGFRALATGGAAAIRAEALARDLKVSKGSFYWHFADVELFKREMIAHWAHTATFQTISRVDGFGGTALERLNQLVEIAAGEPAAEYGGASVEAAIREWARTTDWVRTRVGEVEAARLKFVQGLLLEAGADEEAAERGAHVLYACLIGLQHTRAATPGRVVADLRYALALLVGDILGENP